MIVVDASALTDWLLQADQGGPDIGERLREADFVHTLDLAYIEVASALRRKLARRDLSTERAEIALADLAATRLHVHRVPPLVARIWTLRDSHSAYDAAYVALAEALRTPLLTTDHRLARSHGHNATIVTPD